MRSTWLFVGAVACGLFAGCGPGTEPGPPRLPPERTERGEVIAPRDEFRASDRPMPRPSDVDAATAPQAPADADLGTNVDRPTTAPSVPGQ